MDKKTDRKMRIALNLMDMFNSSGIKWFICFGTLLSFVRDKKLNIDQDIDIGIIGNGSEMADLVRNRYKINHCIRNDYTNEYLNFSYIDTNNDVTIDVFAWEKFAGMYWHTYDTKMEYPKSGILREYTWKGIRSSVFEIDRKVIKQRQQSLMYGRIMKNNGTWSHPLPECPGEGVELCLPANYGSFLDYTYPDWSTTREQFGVSECEAKEVVKTCKGLY